MGGGGGQNEAGIGDICNNVNRNSQVYSIVENCIKIGSEQRKRNVYKHFLKLKTRDCKTKFYKNRVA